MKAENVLMVFIKYPEPGKVKTRLAEMLGTEAAARLYRFMAEDIIQRLKGCEQYSTIIFFDPPDKASHIRNWLGDDQHYIQQSGQDLGKKLSNAFRAIFDSGARRAVVIGTDCLGITQDTVTKTLQYLNERDVVIGPAEDGGYYLLGLSSHTPEIFDSIDWSTNKVFHQTVEKAKQLNLSYTVLEPLKDVDEPSDLPPALLHLL